MTDSLGNVEMFDFSSLHLMNKIVKADDIDFIGVEIGALVKKCPGMNSDMLYALLALRGDITKTDFKEKFEDYVLPQETPPPVKVTPGKTAPPPKQQQPPKPDEVMLMLKRELKIQ